MIPIETAQMVMMYLTWQFCDSDENSLLKKETTSSLIKYKLFTRFFFFLFGFFVE